jgi:hypothetical protein
VEGKSRIPSIFYLISQLSLITVHPYENQNAYQSYENQNAYQSYENQNAYQSEGGFSYPPTESIAGWKTRAPLKIT